MNQIVANAKGDWQAARDFSDRGLEVSPEAPSILAGRAVLQCETGNFSQGEAYLEQLLAAVQRTPRGSWLNRRWLMVIPLITRITGVMERLNVAEETAQSFLSSPSVPPVALQPFRIGLALIDARTICSAGFLPELAWICCDYADTLIQRNGPE